MANFMKFVLKCKFLLSFSCKLTLRMVAARRYEHIYIVTVLRIQVHIQASMPSQSVSLHLFCLLFHHRPLHLCALCRPSPMHTHLVHAHAHGHTSLFKFDLHGTVHVPIFEKRNTDPDRSTCNLMWGDAVPFFRSAEPGEWGVPQSSKLKYTQQFNMQDRMRKGFLTG